MADSFPALLETDPRLDPELLGAVYDALPHSVAILRSDASIASVNREWMLSTADPLVHCSVGRSFLAHLGTLREEQRAVGEHVADGLRRVLDQGAPRFELQYEVRSADGSRWFLVTAAPLPIGGAVVTHTDTTIHHSVQDVLTEMAFHDLLTGLPNRALVIDRIRTALQRAQRSHVFPAVMFLDLDKFKAVNDEHGHAMGDAVLIEAANRLSLAVREGDTCGRWGGDEFVLVIDLTDPVTVGGLVKRTQEAFAEPFVIDGVTIELGLSIGVVVSKPNDRIEHLIHCADEAMYDAKRSGSGVRIVDSRHPSVRDERDVVLHLP